MVFFNELVYMLLWCHWTRHIHSFNLSYQPTLGAIGVKNYLSFSYFVKISDLGLSQNCVLTPLELRLLIARQEPRIAQELRAQFMSSKHQSILKTVENDFEHVKSASKIVV